MRASHVDGSTGPLVVVAEDVESIRTMLSRALELNGFSAVTVADGTQALSRIRELRPAAAVLDWYMPGLDGLEVVREVRAAPETAAMPIVLLTGYDVTEAEESGADAVLGKPFELGELVGILERLVARDG